MFVVDITWSFESLDPIFVLVDGLSFNCIVFINSIFSIYELDLQIFFLDDGLDDRLINIFVGGERHLFFDNVVFDFGRSVDGLKSVLLFSTFVNI